MTDTEIKSSILATIKTNGGSAINADLFGAINAQSRRVVRCANEMVAAKVIIVTESAPNGFGQRRATWSVS